MKDSTFKAATMRKLYLFSRTQALLNQVWNSSEGISFSYSYEPCMKMRLIILEPQIIF